ncbi:MAG: hypothetical protein HY722_10770 [Planctomycetes bacterium]|nr:hypothetical protein [Planctomycetota bacterium]
MAEIHDATRQICGLFESLGLPYAIGGAVAMGVAGVIRATRDVDVLVSYPQVRSQDLADALARDGFTMRDSEARTLPVDAARMTRDARENGHFRVWFQDVRVEVFIPKVPLQHAVLERRRRTDLGDFSPWFTTAEDLVLLKMIFHRPKDLEDVRRLLAANREGLDVAYLRAWLPRTLEEGPRAELLELMRQAGLG